MATTKTRRKRKIVSTKWGGRRTPKKTKTKSGTWSPRVTHSTAKERRRRRKAAAPKTGRAGRRERRNTRKGRAKRPGFATRTSNRSGRGMSGLERYRKTILAKRVYNALRRKGMPKKNAARIANSTMRGKGPRGRGSWGKRTSRERGR